MKDQCTMEDRFEYSPSLISFRDVKQHDPIIKQKQKKNDITHLSSNKKQLFGY